MVVHVWGVEGFAAVVAQQIKEKKMIEKLVIFPVLLALLFLIS